MPADANREIPVLPLVRNTIVRVKGTSCKDFR
jgi:hypothetical protein